MNNKLYQYLQVSDLVYKNLIIIFVINLNIHTRFVSHDTCNGFLDKSKVKINLILYKILYLIKFAIIYYTIFNISAN